VITISTISIRGYFCVFLIIDKSPSKYDSQNERGQMHNFGEYDLKFAPFIVNQMYFEGSACVEKLERDEKLHA